jgi:hypothetical protein
MGIHDLIFSADDDKKLLALLTIRKKLENNASRDFSYFTLSKEFLSSTDNDCKWQSFIIIGVFMETRPDDCWQIIINHGDSNDQDTRAAVATILLEHYFETNPQLFDERFRELKRLIRDGHNNLLRTLKMYKSNWGGDNNLSKVNQFLETQNCGA